MSGNNQSGGDDIAGLIIILIVAGALLYFYKYVVFFVWIPTKIVELWIWSFFHPNYVANLQHFVDTVTVKTLHWRSAEYVNGQFLSIWGKGWVKPVAFLQTALALLMAGLVWHKVRQHGLRPVSSVTELVSLQRKQFPWGWFWLQKPHNRQTALRPHEVFGRQPEFSKSFPILKKQLGRKHLDFEDMSPKLQALYTAFALQNNGKIDDAQDLLRALALGSVPKNTNLAKKDWEQRQARFHFERPSFADALFHARKQNMLPSAWFNWLKIEDRALWMTLSSTPPYRDIIKPFRTAAEAMGPLTWWVYVQYRPLESSVDEELQIAFGSISTMEEALNEVDYVG